MMLFLKHVHTGERDRKFTYGRERRGHSSPPSVMVKARLPGPASPWTSTGPTCDRTSFSPAVMESDAAFRSGTVFQPVYYFFL